MFIRAYLRASTEEQDAERARQLLIDFAAEHDHQIASFYVENESGATLDRPELFIGVGDLKHVRTDGATIANMAGRGLPMAIYLVRVATGDSER